MRGEWRWCGLSVLPSKCHQETRPRKCPFILLIARLTNIRQDETVKDLLAYAKEVQPTRHKTQMSKNKPHIYKEDPRMIWGEHQLVNGWNGIGHNVSSAHALSTNHIFIATCSLWRTSGHVRPTWASVSNTSMRLAD
jgi:hypothetical protein